MLVPKEEPRSPKSPTNFDTIFRKDLTGAPNRFHAKNKKKSGKLTLEMLEEMPASKVMKKIKKAERRMSFHDKKMKKVEKLPETGGVTNAFFSHYTHYEIKGSKALFQYSRYKGILALFAQN